MEMTPFFKSIIDQDRCAVVICDLSHKVIYMNPAAEKRFEKRGGKALIGTNLLACHGSASAEAIVKVVEWFEKARITILSIHFTMKRKTRMCIWSR